MGIDEDDFYDTATHHKTIKTVEERHKVALKTQAVHLDYHLNREDDHKAQVAKVCEKKTNNHPRMKTLFNPDNFLSYIEY